MIKGINPKAKINVIPKGSKSALGALEEFLLSK